MTLLRSHIKGWELCLHRNYCLFTICLIWTVHKETPNMCMWHLKDVLRHNWNSALITMTSPISGLKSKVKGLMLCKVLLVFTCPSEKNIDAKWRHQCCFSHVFSPTLILYHLHCAVFVQHGKCFCKNAKFKKSLYKCKLLVNRSHVICLTQLYNRTVKLSTHFQWDLFNGDPI